MTFRRVDLYVRDDVGDDDNPGTVTAPLKTLAAAEALIPDIVRHPVVIHLGDHPGSGWTWPVFRARVFRDHVVVIGDGGGEAGNDGFTEVVSATAALAGSGSKLVVSSGLNASPRNGYGEHCGSTIEILTGSAAGDRRTIRENTATGYYPITNFTAAIGTGDQYRVVRPSISVEVTDKFILARDCGTRGLDYSEGGSPGVPGYALVLVNLKLNCAGAYKALYAWNSRVLFLGCEVDYNVMLTGESTYRCGVETFDAIGYYGDSADEGTPLGQRIFSAPSMRSWVGWTLTSMSTVGSNANFKLYCAELDGFLVCGWFQPSGSFAIIRGAGFWQGANVAEHESNRYSNVHFASLYTDIKIGGAGTSNALRVSYGDVILQAWNAAFGKLTLQSANSPLVGNRSARIRLYAAQSSAIELVSMTGGTKTGMRVNHTAVINVQSKVPTMSCGGNDFTVDGGSTWQPIANLTPGSHFANLQYGHIYNTGDL